MNAEQLSLEVYEKLVSLNYGRKVNRLAESGDTHFLHLDKEIQDAIRSFPVSYFDGRNDLMDIDNLDKEQQFFIFQSDLGFYLVDTQGYNYPRYITELHGFEIDEIEDQDDSMEMMESLIRIADSQIFDSVVKSLVLELRGEGFDMGDVTEFLLHKLNAATEKVFVK